MKQRRMPSRQRGWLWIIPTVLGALSIGSAAQQQKAAREAAEKQAQQARANADATAQQARDNAVQTQRQMQVAQQRESFARIESERSAENARLANAPVEIDLAAPEADASTASRRRKSFFNSGGSSGAGVGL